MDTEYSADSTEWSPDGSWLACGTYQLTEEETQTGAKERVGRLLLYKVENEAGDDGEDRVCEVWRQDTAAILDMKWSRHGNGPLLALADAVGCLSTFRFDKGLDGLPVGTCVCNDATGWREQDEKEALRLSLEWNTRRNAQDVSPEIVVSDSLGDISLVAADAPGGELRVTQTWNAHSFEAWIAAYDCWQPHLVYSGGDDCRLRGWDTRQNPSVATFTSKAHSMGVCSVQSSPLVEHLLVTGSYDDTIKVWDGRNMRRPIDSVSVGGGVWRLKWHPTDPTLLVAPCMYAGVRLLRVGTEARVVHEYSAHGSIAYGADWHPHAPHRIATCSFYDHQLHLWPVPADI